MHKCLIALAMLAVTATVQAQTGSCENPAVVTQKTYGAINPDAYNSLKSAMEVKDTQGVTTMMAQGTVWRIESASVVCILQPAHMNYRARVSVMSASPGSIPPVPLWIDDRFLGAVN